jgi:hypothetical protein
MPEANKVRRSEVFEGLKIFCPNRIQFGLFFETHEFCDVFAGFVLQCENIIFNRIFRLVVNYFKYFNDAIKPCNVVIIVFEVC